MTSLALPNLHDFNDTQIHRKIYSL